MFSLTKTKDKESLRDPSALTDFYMDNFMCSEFQLKNALCMEEYAYYRFFSFGRSKKYKECINYFDEYKACLIGINQQTVVKRPKVVRPETPEAKEAPEISERIKL